MPNVKNILSESHAGFRRLETGRTSSGRFSRGWLDVSVDICAEAPQTNCVDLAERVAADSIPFWAAAPSVMKLENILLPFDFSAASVQLLRGMTSLAEKLRAKLTIVHVVQPWVPADLYEPPHPYDPNEERLQTGRVLLNRLLRSVCRRDGFVFTHFVVGEPTEEILKIARATKPDLIAMTSHGPRVLKQLFVSATTERVARQARCPVLVVPKSVLDRREQFTSNHPRKKSPRILVPTDFSANSAAAMRFAAFLAKAYRAELHVLNFSGAFAPLPQEARARLDKWVQSTLPIAGNVKSIMCEGEPSVYMLVRYAELLGADLIALGPRGYSWAQRRRLHSTTDGILRNASCPVLSLRAGTHPAGL